MSGHECSAIGGICVNTIGSYECICEDGFNEIDEPAHDFINPETGEPWGLYHVCYPPAPGKQTKIFEKLFYLLIQKYINCRLFKTCDESSLRLTFACIILYGSYMLSIQYT